jgi:hypothetical protein
VVGAEDQGQHPEHQHAADDEQSVLFASICPVPGGTEVGAVTGIGRRVILVVAVGVLLAGCQSGGAAPPPLPSAPATVGPSGTTAPTATTSAPPGRTLTSGDVTLVLPARATGPTLVLLRDYLAFWAAYTKALAVPDANSAELRRRSDPRAFAAFSRTIDQTLVRPRRALRGPVRVTPRLRPAAGPIVVIDDCIDATGQQFFTRSGQATPERGQRNSFTVSLRHDNAGYIVTAIADAPTEQCKGP